MPNTYDPTKMQMMGYLNAPPDIQAGASEIFKQQKLAELLRNQAIAPIKADEYTHAGSGQWAAPPQIVPIGIGQGLAKMGTALVGGYMDKKASEDSLALANKLREAKKAHYSELFGSEAVPGQTTAPIGGQEAGTLYTDDYTAVPATDQQGYKTLDTPATPGLQGKDLARALAQSWMPEFEKAGLHMMTNPPKPQVHALPEGGTLVGEDGKIIASGSPKRVPPQFKEEYVNGPKGEPMVQKMVSIDNGITWKPEGATSPRFARQVPAVINIGQEVPEKLTEAGQKVLDDLVKAGKTPPGGWSKNGISRGNASLNRIGAEMVANGSTETLPGMQGDYKSAAAGHTAITKDLTAIEPFEKMLQSNAKIAIDLGKKAIATEARFANKPINWLKQNASDNPDVADFLAQTTFVQTEAARVLNNPRLVGQLTDAARHEMQQVVNGDMPLNAYTRVVERVVSDGERRIAEMRKTQTDLSNKMNRRSTDKKVDTSPTPAPASAPAGLPSAADIDAELERRRKAKNGG